jgi:hypothetical protein
MGNHTEYSIKRRTCNLVDTRNTYGTQAAELFKSDDQRMASMNRSLADLEAFTDVERRLLIQRSQKAEADFQNTERLVMFGSLMAALLLVLANLMTNRWTILLFFRDLAGFRSACARVSVTRLRCPRNPHCAHRGR